MSTVTKMQGMPSGRTIYDGGNWRIIQDTLNLRWHVVQFLHRDRGIDHWATTFTTRIRDDLAGHLAWSRDLSRDEERLLAELPWLVQGYAGRNEKDDMAESSTTNLKSRASFHAGAPLKNSLPPATSFRKRPAPLPTAIRTGNRPHTPNVGRAGR